MELTKILEQRFGYTSFRPGQREVIEQLVNGQDVVALLPTGMGKSLCYQLPGYIFDKPVLVVSPLLSLMQDQVDQMKQFGEKRVVALNSFLSADQKQYAMHFLHEYRFIFTSPEMLLQPAVQQRLSEIELSLIVADEAHCISQWGFDFRPDYLRIGEFIQHTNRPPILALSATATESVLADIEQYLTMHQPFHSIHPVDRPNIAMAKVQLHAKEDKLPWILQHVSETAGPGIIYTQSRAKTEALSIALMQQGIASAAYHAGKDAEDRQFIQQQFLTGELEWIVATNAFGMGVHKHNIRQVIHESMPATVANYMQEIGRAGRDGEQSLATLLYVDGDDQMARFIATDDLPRSMQVDDYARYLVSGENPLELVKNGALSETAYRVIHYWMQHETSEQVKQRLVNMEISKNKSVDEMLQILNDQQCMRKKVVAHFGQEMEKQPVNCCSYCGIELKDVVSERNIEIRQPEKFKWQERLYNLIGKA